MTRGDYNEYRGWTIPEDENPQDDGYLVKYPEGYESWCPKDVFDKHNMPIEGDHGKVSELDVRSFIAKTEVITIGRTTILIATLANGFEIVESSSCVDPNNYDEELGARICMERIRNKVWELLGFLLQCSRGLNQDVPCAQRKGKIKSLHNTDVNGAKKNVPDLETFGDSDTFKLLCKASSKSEGWMKSTKAMEIPHVGCVVQVTTQQGDNVAEALCFVPGVEILQKQESDLDCNTNIYARELIKTSA